MEHFCLLLEQGKHAVPFAIELDKRVLAVRRGPDSRGRVRGGFPRFGFHHENVAVGALNEKVTLAPDPVVYPVRKAPADEEAISKGVPEFGDFSFAEGGLGRGCVVKPACHGMGVPLLMRGINF